MLILTTLTWSTISYSDGYADIGYKSGFNIEVAMNVTGPFYMRAELGDLVNSYGFGLADHSISQEEIERDGRFQGYDISWTNDGY